MSDPPDRPDSPPAPSWSGERPRPVPTGLVEALMPLGPLFALDVLTAFTVGMIPPVLPLMATDFGLATVEAGLINTVYAVGRLGGSFPGSWIRARHGTRTAVFLGLGGLIAGSIGCTLAPTFPVLLLARLVMGFGASAAFVAVFAELLESASQAWRGRLANAFEFTAILSLAVGSTLAAGLGQGAGWRSVFGAASLMMLACFAFARRLPPRAGRQPPETGGGGRWPSAADLRAFAPIYAACLALSMTWAGLFATLAPLLGAEQYGLAAGAIGLALSAGYVAELAGLALVGLLIDRIPREPVFAVGAMAVTLGGLLLALGGRPTWFVLALLLMGAGFAVWMIPATVLADRAGTPLAPAHLATYRIALDGGMILGPLVLGLVGTMAGDRAAAGAAGAILLASAAALMRSRPPPRAAADGG